MPRTIREMIAALPLDRQKEIEKQYQELRATLPPPQTDEASDASSTAPETKQHPQHRS